MSASKPARRITTTIPVETNGLFDIAISVTTLKSPKSGPRIAIVNGLHGEERTGALLMKRLIEQAFEFEGELALIPFANPPSALANTRLTPEDAADLNRIFPGDASGSLSQRIAAALYDFLKDFDLVVDIHSFPRMKMPFIGVFFNVGTQDQRRRIVSLLRELNPEYIWKLDTKEGETAKAGSLVEALIANGTLAFAMEAPDIELISSETEMKCTEGLLRVIQHFNARAEHYMSPIPVVERVPAFANRRGVFVPRIGVHVSVNKGDIVGEIVSLDRFESSVVTSPISGTMLFILHNTVVAPSQRVAIIGKATEINI